uniref:PKS_AT domain-containing protein n=1 Tax=Strongyloides venezuelensis TaxID=75913 RepID=A0A0K0FSI1_STRVS
MNSRLLIRSRNALNILRRGIRQRIVEPKEIIKEEPINLENLFDERVFQIEQIDDKNKPLKEIDFSHIPIERQAVIFCPGQGAQTVGMLEKTKKENPKSLKLLDEASQILGYNLQEIIDNGPSTKLNQTIYTQPAIVVSSLIAYENLKILRPDIEETLTHVAGFSVGEYTAAVISGILSFEKALEIVKARAEAMHKCCQFTRSMMIVVSTKASSRLEDLMRDSNAFATEVNGVPLCEIASFLFCGHKVIGMSEDAYKFFSKYASDYDVTLGKVLQVEGAFHTRLMSKAVTEIKPLFEDLKLEMPFCNVYSNVTGKVMERKYNSIRWPLLNQICNPVKWETIQQYIYRKNQKVNGKHLFPMYFEVGPGKSLGAMWARTSKKAYQNYRHISC